MQSYSQMLTLLELLDALESQVNKDSNKSSKRPSSDGPSKKTRSLRDPSGKMAGGQTEHKGTLLRQIERPTQVIQHRLPSSAITAAKLCPHGDAWSPNGAMCSRCRWQRARSSSTAHGLCAATPDSAYQHISGRRGRGGAVRPVSRPACSLPLNCHKMNMKYIVFFTRLYALFECKYARQDL